MATNLIPSFSATAVQPSASSSSSATVKPDQSRRSWWSPIFGWSSDPDYVSSDVGSAAVKLTARSDRVAPVVFTEEKARRLRMLTQETYHDKMYHSAIASRLATEYGHHSDM